MTLQEKIIEIIVEENKGLLPDELELEAESILYGKDIYERAKYELSVLQEK